MHFVDSGSTPGTSKACEAQLVEQNIEAIWVVSSSLIASINRCAGIGIQVPLRMEWFKYLASSTLVIYIFVIIRV